MNVYNSKQWAQEWEVQLCESIEGPLNTFICKHFAESPKSRLVFSGNMRHTWMPRRDKFVFTKRNLAMLHPPVAARAEEFVISVLQTRCLAIQEEIQQILPVILASDDEYKQVMHFERAADFFFDNVAEHLCEQEHWRTELRNRYPLIEFLRDRERVIDRLITFEEWKLDPAKYNDRQTTMNFDAKFRSYAAGLLEKMNHEAVRRLTEYEEKQGRPLTVYGNPYWDYLEASVSELAMVRTNFHTLTRDALILLFDIPPVSVPIQQLLDRLLSGVTRGVGVGSGGNYGFPSVDWHDRAPTASSHVSP